MNQKSQIDELQRLLNSEEETPIQILPNGEIREAGTFVDPRSGRGGRRFKSCHSDHQIKRSAQYCIAEMGVDAFEAPH